MACFLITDLLHAPPRLDYIKRGREKDFSIATFELSLMNPTINPAFLATDSLEAELIAQLQSQSLNATEDALGDAPNFSLFNTTYDNHVERSPAIPQGFEGGKQCSQFFYH
jgi:hypothetical protein